MDEIRKLLFTDRSEVVSVILQMKGGVPLWHPLGFVSLLLKKGDGWALKLHYWPMETRRPKTPDWQIHDHRFHLESRVLNGALDNWTYRIEEGGSDRLLPVSYSGKDSVIEPSGRPVTAVLEKKETHSAGAVYTIPRTTFHQSFVSLDSCAITIVLQSDFVQQPPFVVGKEGVHIQEYRRFSYDKDKLWDEIQNSEE